MKKILIVIISVLLVTAIAIGVVYAIDMNRMKNNEPVFFSAWGYDYAPPEKNPEEFYHPIKYIRSFAATVLEETTTYMIVEPIEDKADGEISGKVKVEYGTDHIDYLYGEGRRVVIYFEEDSEKLSDGMFLIHSDNISTDGFREFELSVEASGNKEKRLVLSADDIESFSDFPEGDTANLYYYGLDNVFITIKGFTMPLETAIEKGRITLWGIVSSANGDVADGVIPELVYKDGGSQVYKYPDFTIIKYHTIDGNQDVYIGTPDMEIDIAGK